MVFLDNVKKKFTYQVPEGAHLILGLAKPIAKFSEGIILDLSKEKPWDRDKRIATQVVAHAHALGKQNRSSLLKRSLSSYWYGFSTTFERSG